MANKVTTELCSGGGGYKPSHLLWSLKYALDLLELTNTMK